MTFTLASSRSSKNGTGDELVSIESVNDLDGITRAGRVVAEALRAMERATRVGVTTAAIDAVGATVLARHGAHSAPQRVYGCPSATLISVNDEIVHGLPGARPLKPGDIVKLDVTADVNGYIADAARTIVLPGASETAMRLRDCAVAAFRAGIAAATAGRRVSEIGRAVEREVVSRGFHVLRDLSGHGVGRTIHEPPTVRNYFDPFQRDRLTEGLVLTIEPLIAERRTAIVEDPDGWTLRTRSGCLAAHHEHTLIITRDVPMIVTA
jgi:methionyl aminopeptidase